MYIMHHIVNVHNAPYMVVYQTVQTHAQILFYTHQYFQGYPYFQSTSITQPLYVNMGEDRDGLVCLDDTVYRK